MDRGALTPPAPSASRLDRGGLRRSSGGTAVLPSVAPGSSRAWLVLGEQTLPLDPTRAHGVGCAPDNDVVLTDPFVSARHCRVHFAGGAWRVVDLGSTNGTAVNGLRVLEAELPDGARLQVGRVELCFRRSPGRRPRGPSDMVAESPAMKRVLGWVERYARSREPVLVVGQSGTGKEGVSRALHATSTRADGPFVALNCGALAAGVVESELFGHVKGAFTGATSDKKGAFEAASGGTLFLDEVGELPVELQPKLLRVLETRTLRRVGGTDEIPVDTRIVAATHRDLSQLVREGRFREDLLHRLFVLSIVIPPLSARPEDIAALAERFAAEADPPRRLSSEALAALRAHPWPGNARELRNVVVRAALATDDEVIRPRDLQFGLEALGSSRPTAPATARTLSPAETAERDLFAHALLAERGNRAAAARRLGLSRSTFHDRARRLGLAAPASGERGARD